MTDLAYKNLKKTKKSKCSSTKHTVLNLFNVCSNHAPWNNSWQESKPNLQFIILTHLWPWNKVKVIKSGMNSWTPEQGYNHANFERLPWNSVLKKANIEVSVKSDDRKHISYLPWICAQVKKGLYSLSTWLST